MITKFKLFLSAAIVQTFRLTEKQNELIREVLSGEERHCLVYGGSRSGKTFLTVYAIVCRCLMAPGSRHVIFRRHGVAVKQSIGQDTFPKVMDLAFPGVEYKIHMQEGYIEVWNYDTTGKRLPASEIWLAGLEDKDRVDKVLGKEYATIYLNEASEISYGSYSTVMTRLAQVVENTKTKQPLKQKCYADLNPTTKAHWTYKLFVQGIEPISQKRVIAGDYVYGVANPTDNHENLDKRYIRALQDMPEKQRKRFFDGEFTADVEEALWRRDSLQRMYENTPKLARVVVAIDPAVSNEIGSDETGIIVAGIDDDGSGYVLEDASGRYSPEEWARVSINLFKSYDADRVVAEVNQGGDMVETVLRAHEANLPYRAVRATRGKFVRAEPIAALYERKKVYHVGEFDTLEEQMCSFTVDFDRKAQGYSPDRVDALVWAFTDLFPQMTSGKSREAAKAWMGPEGYITSVPADAFDPLAGL